MHKLHEKTYRYISEHICAGKPGDQVSPGEPRPIGLPRWYLAQKAWQRLQNTFSQYLETHQFISQSAQAGENLLEPLEPVLESVLVLVWRPPLESIR